MEDKTYSVLMSVYYKEKAEFLRESMESIYRQTIPTDDFILVCDGPLNAELDAVIEEQKKRFEDALHVVRLEKNRGLGSALNEGMNYCRHELVARMDSDDISCADRCERQLKIFRDRPDVDICSGIVEEFVGQPENSIKQRVLPETQEEIIRFAKSRNPFNHPCVMYKKSAVKDSGNYQDFYLLEDYYLWIRMLIKGYRGYNLPELLLHMRAGSDMYKRRSGWRDRKSVV